MHILLAILREFIFFRKKNRNFLQFQSHSTANVLHIGEKREQKST